MLVAMLLVWSLAKPNIRSITQSRTLAKHCLEHNLTMLPLKKELLAVVFVVDKFRSYLVGAKVIIYTNHAALKYLITKKLTLK